MSCYAEGDISWGSASMGAVSGSISLSGLSDGSGFSSMPGSLGLSDVVSFNRASSIDVTSPNTGNYLHDQTFDVTVIASEHITEPTDIYEGDVNTSCMDGLAITNTDSANDIILSYSPPMPPDVTLSMNLPTKPDFSIDQVDLIENSTDTDVIAVLPDLYNVLETATINLLDNTLANLSDDAIQELNDLVYRGGAQTCLSLRGISLINNDKAETILARQKDSLTRELLILKRKANNTTVASDALTGLNNVRAETHSIHQQARLDNAKLNVFIAMQNIVLSVMLFNSEVKRALVDYAEFAQMTKIEIERLNIYKKQLQNTELTLDGNIELSQAYNKQLEVVKQVFDAYESSMKLSEMVLKFTTAQIQVETENIKTDTMLIEGDAEQTQNRAYQSKTAALAHNIDIEADVAKKSADILVDKEVLEKSLLDIEKTIKNNLIDADNDYLQAVANAVSAKIRNVQNLFDLDNLKTYNNMYLSFLSSHQAKESQNDINQQHIYDVHTTLSAKTNAASKEKALNDAHRAGYDVKVKGYTSYLEDVESAAEIMAVAKTKQQLIQTITST